MQHKLDKIDKEIISMSLLLSQTPDDNPDRLLLLFRLKDAHIARYQLSGELGDIQKMIESMTTLVALIPCQDPAMPSLLSNLGLAHNQRFTITGNIQDIEKDLEYTGLALSMTPNSHPGFPLRLYNLALSHRARFQRLDKLDDIEEAIEYGSRAVNALLRDHPSLPEWLTELGTSHSIRFRRLQQLHDIKKAIVFQSHAFLLAPDNHPDLSTMLAGLGISHVLLFQRFGELDDVEKAIEYNSHALALMDTPDGHPNLPGLLSNLGTSHRYRFQRLGEKHDIENAIKCQSRALDLAPKGHPQKPNLLCDLGISYYSRFQRLRELNDLEKSIEYQSHAIDLTPDDHPDLPNWLADLGISHSYRFEQLEDPNDIDKAIDYQIRAISLTPKDHPRLSGRRVNLGASYTYRFQLSGSPCDIENAIEHQSCSLKNTSEDHPDLCLTHFNLALSYISYSERTNNPSHLLNSLHYFRNACKSLVGGPRERFKHARQWAAHASIHNALNPIEAYQATIDLLPQLAWLGATDVQRYEDLSTTQTLAVDAASVALLSSNHTLALEWLEHARCVVWSQYLMLRSPLDPLIASHPSLGARLQKVVTQLHNASSASMESQSSHHSLMTPEQIGQERRRLATEFEKLLTQIRELPGCEDFLQPRKTNRLVNAARNGPIVVINCHKDRCDALLILPQQDDVNHIPLPNFNRDKAQLAHSQIEMSIKSPGRRGREAKRRPLPGEDETYEFESVLATLWDDVVKPILDFLGFTSHIPTGSLPHITWCPTGVMTFLPLHAAGDYSRPRSRVFDYVVSSYTPTLTALLESAPHSLSRDSRVLAVGQTATLGHSPLPFAAIELEYVKSRTQGRVECLTLVDDQATTITVLDEMERHDWVHLACHAHQNATESGFFLHDGVLDLASINRRSLKRKGLAFLSACETATGDKRLPDEAVHLASGMLMAGFTSVIATMWSVADSDAPLVADKVYDQLMKDGKLGNGEAGRALHEAVAVLRDKVGENAFESWVPYIHIGS